MFALMAWSMVVMCCLHTTKAGHQNSNQTHNYTKYGMPNYYDPVLTEINSTTKQFVEGAGAVIILPRVDIHDADHESWPFIEWAKATVTKNYQWGVDKVLPSEPLSLTSPTSPLQASWDHTLGTLFINGTATIEEYESYLRGLVFICDSATPKEWLRTISVTINDGAHDSQPLTVDVAVTGINEKPQLLNWQSPMPLVYTSKSALTLLPTADLEIKDSDHSSLAWVEFSMAETNITRDVFQMSSLYNIDQITWNWVPEFQTLRLEGAATLEMYALALGFVQFYNLGQIYAARRTDFDVTSRVVQLTLNDGIESTAYTLSVEVIRVLVFTEQPAAETVIAPSLTYTTHVNVTGTGTITFEWFKYDVNGTESMWDPRVPKTNQVLEIQGLLFDIDSATYKCKVSNEAGYIWSSEAVLKVWAQYRVPTWFTDESNRQMIAPEVLAQYPDHIVLKWLPPDGNGFGIKRYVVDIKTPADPTKWKRHTVSTILCPDNNTKVCTNTYSHYIGEQRSSRIGTNADPIAIIKTEDWNFQGTEWELQFRVRAYNDDSTPLTGLPSAALQRVFAHAKHPTWKATQEYSPTWDNILWSTQGPKWTTSDGLYWQGIKSGYRVTSYSSETKAVVDPLNRVYMTIRSTSTPEPFYEWRKDGILLEGEDRDNMYIEAVDKSAHAGRYTVTIGNYLGNITSESFVLEVTSSPSIVWIDEEPEQKAGHSFTLTCHAKSILAPSRYVWYRLQLPPNDTTSSDWFPAATSSTSVSSTSVSTANSSLNTTSAPTVAPTPAPTVAPTLDPKIPINVPLDVNAADSSLSVLEKLNHVVKLTTNRDGSQLTIVDFVASDEGKYSCVAVNDACEQLTEENQGSCQRSEHYVVKVAACTSGQRKNAEGYCVKCEQGRYQTQNLHRETTCIACQRGMFQAKRGQTSCHYCHPGSYAAARSQILCDDCLPGTFAPLYGTATICSQCPSSMYTNSRKKSSCEFCAPGLAQPLSGQTKCTQCQPGDYAQPGMSKCEKCPEGKYSFNIGSPLCETCVAGKYQDYKGVTTCKDCPLNTWSDVPGIGSLANCNACSSTTKTLQSGSDKSMLCVCEEGKFDEAHLYITEPDLQICKACPEGADCDELGNLLPTMNTESGWWREDSWATEMFECVSSHVDDKGDHFDCIGGVPADSKWWPTYKGRQCSNETEGVLCSQCKEGFWRDGNGKCESCAAGSAALLTFCGAAGLVGLFGFLVCFFLWPDRHSELARVFTERMKRHKIIDMEKDVDAGTYRTVGLEVAIAAASATATNRYARKGEQLGLVDHSEPMQGKMKILISWAQCIGVLAFTFNIPWPAEFSLFLTYLYGVFNLDVWSMFGSYSCYMDTSWLTGYTADVATMPAIVILIGVAYFVAKRVLGKRGRLKGFVYEKDQRWELTHRIVEGIHEKFAYDVFKHAHFLKKLMEHSAHINFKAKHEIKVLEGAHMSEVEGVKHQEPPPLFLQDECCRTVEGLLSQAQQAQEVVKEILEPQYPYSATWKGASRLNLPSYSSSATGESGELKDPSLPWIDRAFDPGVKGRLWCQHAVDFTTKRQGTFRRVHDACSIIIQCDSCKRMMQAKAEIHKLFRVKAIHNRHSTPTVLSRSDMLIWVEVDLPDGNTHIVELVLEHTSFGIARDAHDHEHTLQEALLNRCGIQTQDMLNVHGFILHTMQDYHPQDNPHSYIHSEAYFRQICAATIRAKQAILFIIFLVYPGVLQRLLLVFKCTKIASKSYLSSDLSVVCWEGSHEQYWISAAVLLAFFGVGIPLAIFLFLLRHRSTVSKTSDPVFKAQYGSLYAQYEPQFWYFEFIVTARKIMLAGGLVLVKESGSAQVLIGLVVCVLYLLILLNLRPFRFAYDFRLEQISAVQLVLTLLVGLFLQLREEGGYIDHSAAWTTLLIFTTALMFVATAAAIVLPQGGEEMLQNCVGSIARSIYARLHRLMNKNAVRPMHWDTAEEQNKANNKNGSVTHDPVTEIGKPTFKRSRSVDSLRPDMLSDKKVFLRDENVRLKSQLEDKSHEHNELIELGELRGENKALREENLALAAELTGLKTRKLAGEPSAEAIQALHSCPMTLLDLAYRKGVWETEVECDICQKTVFVQRGFPLDYCTECNYCVCNGCAKKQIMNFLPPPPDIKQQQDDEEKTALALLQPMITVEIEEKACAIQKTNANLMLNEMTLRAKKLDQDTPVHQRKKVLSELRQAQVAVSSPGPLTLKDYHAAIDQSTQELKKDLKSQLVAASFNESLVA